MPQINRKKPKDVNMYPIGLGNTRISTKYAQKPSQIEIGVEVRVASVCMFDKFHLMLIFKSKVSHDVFKNKNECSLTSTSSSKM